MLKKFRISEQKIIGEQGEVIGTIKDVIFTKTHMLHPIALLIEVNGKEIEIPFSFIKIKDDNLIIQPFIKDWMKVSIEPSQYMNLEPFVMKMKVFPKAIKLLNNRKREEETLIIKIDINEVLLSKCPLCMGEVKPTEEFTFCPSCLTPYHKSCINEILKSNSEEKCWSCNNINLVRLI
jgi:sporulation protein YlmC with PRC-barrel domain